MPVDACREFSCASHTPRVRLASRADLACRPSVQRLRAGLADTSGSGLTRKSPQGSHVPLLHSALLSPLRSAPRTADSATRSDGLRRQRGRAHYGVSVNVRCRSHERQRDDDSNGRVGPLLMPLSGISKSVSLFKERSTVELSSCREMGLSGSGRSSYALCRSDSRCVVLVLTPRDAASAFPNASS